MKVLMFGWEFPPFISGGLGSACLGITRGLISNDVDLTFVIPTRRDRDISNTIRIIGADEIPLFKNKVALDKAWTGLMKRLKFYGVETEQAISPYLTSDYKILSEEEREELNYFASREDIDDELEGTSNRPFAFTGGYGENLMEEVIKYGLVGKYISRVEDFDIIHAHDWLTYVAGVQAKQASGKPLVVHVHATEFDRSGENMNTSVYDIEKYGMEVADRIVAVSFYTKNIITKYYNISPDKIDVVHNAISKEKQIERLNIKKNFDEKIVLSLGRVTMQKGPEYFLEAANLVLKKLKNVRFVMAGSGDLLPHIITRMAALKIADKFHFTGNLRGIKVEEMYAMSDLYVMPSVSEPFGLTPFEALLYDVPIIISKQSGAAEVLKNAVTVDFWDVRKLADTIIAILEDENLARAIVERCQDEMKHIEWNNAGRKLKEIYETLLR